ncbi:MAG: sigma-70 family RNA polymerase sigma factor [Planctomycetota bacterium]|jgi:RNA polymerase sigma-70 factor (ECF subfamily)
MVRAFLQSPEGGAYTDIVNKHSSFVFRVAFNVLRDRTLAEDAAQETFLTLLRSQAAFQPAGSLKAWLGRVAYRAALKTLRASGRRKRHEEAAGRERVRKETTMDPEKRETLNQLRQFVLNLPLELRTAVDLKYFQKVPQTDIAAILECSTGTVSNRLKDALGRLRTSMAQAGMTAVIPALESHLPDIPAEPVPTSLAGRLNLLPESGGPAVVAKGGSILAKVGLGTVLAVSALLGFAFVVAKAFPGGGDDERISMEAITPGEPSSASPGKPAVPRGVEGPGEGEASTVPMGEPPPVVPGEGPGPREPRKREDPSPLESTSGECGLFGTVTDKSGNPVPKARITVSVPAKPYWEEKTRRHTETGPDGRWRVDNLSSRASWRVQVRKSGFARWMKRLKPFGESKTKRVDATLHRSWSLRGTLRDVDGRPVTLKIWFRLQRGKNIRGFPLQPGEDGSFSHRDIDPKTFPLDETTVTFVHAVLLDVTLESLLVYPNDDGWIHVDVVFPEGARISGTVRGPGGLPEAGARVLLTPEGAGPWDRGHSETADGEGRFVFRGLPKGKYRLDAWGKHRVQERSVAVVLEDFEVKVQDVTLGSGRTLEGRLVDMNGRAVPGIRLTLDALGGALGFGGSRTQESTTGKDGSFRFEGLTLDNRTFTIHFWGLGASFQDQEEIQVEKIDNRPLRMTVVIRVPKRPPEEDPDVIPVEPPAVPAGVQTSEYIPNVPVEFPKEKD